MHSLILKIFDICLLLLVGQQLSNDDSQLGFQENCSTLQCTWAVQETISYFIRNYSDVFCCLLDFTKAFDKVNFEKLFRKLIDGGLSMIFIRLILVMYEKQTANVRWNGTKSKSFPISNGVKQGAVLSAILYCFYVNGLFQLLRKRKQGCWVQGTYAGIVGYV